MPRLPDISRHQIGALHTDRSIGFIKAYPHLVFSMLALPQTAMTLGWFNQGRIADLSAPPDNFLYRLDQ
jgi:hypothetical protein